MSCLKSTGMSTESVGGSGVIANRAGAWRSASTVIREDEELNRICATSDMALIADEVFLEYTLTGSTSANVLLE